MHGFLATSLSTSCSGMLKTFLKKKLLLVWPCSVGPSVTTSSTDFSFQKNLVFGNLFEYSASENYLEINISHISESKSYQINSIKSCSSRSFQQHERHVPSEEIVPIPPKFSATI
jgi:hypothetical protein